MSNLPEPIRKLRYQRTFAMIKPDGVARGLTGEILKRFEVRGLKIVSMKMVRPTDKQIMEHYVASREEWIRGLGQKGVGTFHELHLDIKEHMGTDDELEIGKIVYQGLVEYMKSGPVIPMVIEGVQAVEMVRKLVGPTIPLKAELGTIRGDFSVDSTSIANVEKRSIHNLIHASGNLEEAEYEIKVWFDDDEIFTYKRSDEDFMFEKYY
ncbi:nucleoside-diphosphate kinase [bacterium]|nr:MAG: nucleoside-diphosphate kinase [bacterium]